MQAEISKKVLKKCWKLVKKTAEIKKQDMEAGSWNELEAGRKVMK